MNLPLLSSFVCGPAVFRGRDILPLTLFCVSAKQNYQGGAVLAKIDPVTRSEIDLLLKDTGTNAFDIREISLLHPGEGDGYLGGRSSIESFKPFGERSSSLVVDVAAKLKHPIAW